MQRRHIFEGQKLDYFTIILALPEANGFFEWGSGYMPEIRSVVLSHFILRHKIPQ